MSRLCDGERVYASAKVSRHRFGYNFSAEYGQGGRTITQVVSQTGTNQVHGSAFEFVRNGAFDARNYFSTSSPGFPAVPPFKRNEFGATIAAVRGDT